MIYLYGMFNYGGIEEVDMRLECWNAGTLCCSGALNRAGRESSQIYAD